MFMINIPRRKIYETMLEYEEYLLELQILIRNENNFKKYKEEYKNSYKNIIKSYQKIKALFILFFENKKYETEEDFEADVNYYIKEEKETNALIKKNKALSKDYLELQNLLDEEFKKKQEIVDINEGKNLFKKLDEFNSFIPKILEIRRDFMQ